MIGQRLREVRVFLNLTQKDLAKILRVDQKTISHWERNRNEPNLEALRTFCSEFKVNLNWLLTGEGPMFVGGSKVADIKDIPKEQIKEFIEEFWQKANEKERIWFEVQFKRAFPEYTDWLQKKQLSQTDQDIKDSQGTLQTNGLNV